MPILFVVFPVIIIIIIIVSRHDFAHRMWSAIRSSDISQEHKRLLRELKS